MVVLKEPFPFLCIWAAGMTSKACVFVLSSFINILCFYQISDRLGKGRYGGALHSVELYGINLSQNDP